MIAEQIKPRVWPGSNIGSDASYISLMEIAQKPQLITDILLQDDRISIVIERHGDQIRLAYMKVYQPSARRILHEAREEYAALLDGPGYSREQAIEDFQEAQEEISRHLQ